MHPAISKCGHDLRNPRLHLDLDPLDTTKHVFRVAETLEAVTYVKELSLASNFSADSASNGGERGGTRGRTSNAPIVHSAPCSRRLAVYVL